MNMGLEMLPCNSKNTIKRMYTAMFKARGFTQH